MVNIVLCSQQPAQLVWLDYSFGRADYSCRITTEWNVLLGVVQHSAVDAILLDAAMGDIEARCREFRARTNAPLIVINGDGTADVYQTLRAAGADEVVAIWTPFPELLGHIEGTLRTHQLAATR